MIPISKIIPFFILLLSTVFSLACTTISAPSLAERKTAADLSMAMLQRSDFTDAATEADRVLTADAGNPYAALVKAIAQYKATMHQFFLDGRTLVIGTAVTRSINQQYLQTMLERTEAELTEVQRLLAVAAREPEVSMELCVACMNVDWNQDGRVTPQDSILFEVEVDENNRSIQRDDPRRKPTFRIDYGDVIWAQAFVSFHLAALNVLTAYDFSEITANFNPKEVTTATLKLIHPEKIALAQRQLLDGLAFSLASREAYLKETDDDREWLPSPTQKNHPIPLEVTEEFYTTWKLVATDLQRIVSGEEAFSVTELAQLGDHQWNEPPRGYINIGKLFSNAKDITIDLEQLEYNLDELEDAETAVRVEQLLEELLGFCYVKHAKPTPLLSRIDRMKSEVEMGQESIERKLKYLFWVN
ncbi:MAG: hypothetical protein JXX29_20790 [Deltaproteobacteria bacterium]|nr:hypothetical protein [Deltaproteobacteria bacterium]MBN2674131.1 hypothetical protein [Deltaproteobacteria bacterium]